LRGRKALRAPRVLLAQRETRARKVRQAQRGLSALPVQLALRALLVRPVPGGPRETRATLAKLPNDKRPTTKRRNVA